MDSNQRSTDSSPGRYRIGQLGSIPQKTLDYISMCLVVVLSAIPVVNILHILLTTGSGNLSNDYAIFMPVIDKILSGQYLWGNFFRDSFYASHFQVIPMLIYLGSAKFTAWNINFELLMGWSLSIFRIFLTYQLLTQRNFSRYRFLLLLPISALIFSTSQISTFEFGPTATQFGLTVFGFTLGVWGLVKFTGKPIALFIMVLGGVIASWTAATGVMAWMIFFVALFLLGYKKLWSYIGWLVSAFVVNFPYLYFLVINRKPGVNAVWQNLLDIRLIVNLLGRPLADGIGSSTGFLLYGELAGWLGLILGVVGVTLLFIKMKQRLLLAIPAILFMVYGIFAAWQTSVFRVMIAPWYTSITMPYWIGLVGLAFVFLWPDGREMGIETRQSTFHLSPRMIYPTAVLITVLGLYFSSNLTYRDKTFFLKSRSPVAASCLRNYANAPTYCERRVFQWTVNRVYLADFGWLLQRHHLNVFSSHQVWSMQGDTILGNVYSTGQSNIYKVEWFDGLAGNPTGFSDYHHLNLAVAPSQSIIWKVRIPDNLKSAEFLSAVGVSSNLQTSTPVTFNVYIASQGSAEKLLYSQTVSTHQEGWNKFSIDLLSYKGQVINIRLAVNTATTSVVSLYKYPTIDIVENPEPTLTDKPEITPTNTELSPDVPKTQPDDYIFSLDTAEIHGLERIDHMAMGWHLEQNPYLSSSVTTPIDLSDFGWLSFTESVSTDVPSRAAQFFLYFEGQDQPLYLEIPLLPDGGTHSYTYPLHLFGITGKLVAIRFHPVLVLSQIGENVVKVSDLRLIHLP